MSEVTPVAVTQRAAEAAANQSIVGFEANPPDIAKLLEITGREGDIAVDGLVTTIGYGTGLRKERANTQLWNAVDLTVLAEEVDKEAAQTVIPLNVPHKQPINEAELARRFAAELLRPALARNDFARTLPGGLSAALGPVALIPGTIMYYYESPQTELQWGLIGTGVTLMGIGGLVVRSANQHERQHDMAQFGAAPVLRPIIVHRMQPGNQTYSGRRRA